MRPLWTLLCLGSAVAAARVAGIRCKEDEVRMGGECCPKCSDGYQMKKPCTPLTGTVCESCPNGTFSVSGKNCTNCTKCTGHKPVTAQVCTRTHDTVCAPHYTVTPREDKEEKGETGRQHHHRHRNESVVYVGKEEGNKSNRTTLAWLSVLIFLVGIVLLILYLVTAYRSDRCQNYCPLSALIYRSL
ncbi:membrane glycoprotein UL144 [Panine betaherpesvirus 2]|uniref:Membrane glycoprotein UL144 n=1 Tax=Panine betaherpesvirus 2 TaxID=188763 RepID=Q8QRX4_9BETA|nr:membrane glycoprotein UL144 [Panine betaherpesvirus 2]AAM00763.1 membrane glycoprotein UL144 [Panine betaherpesvirus 2]QXV67877.1 membrane glycoprotein UL144 [Panine betaherpesvirus 2]